MMQWIKDNTVSVAKAAGMSRAELKKKFVTGIFEDRNDQDDYYTAYKKIIDRLGGEENE